LRTLPALALLLVYGGTLAAQTPPPERTVRENVISSPRDPRLQIHLPASVHYVGADRWLLVGMDDCELHAFVSADANQRLYWVQFEAYLPSRPELHHTYDSPRRVTLGGMSFYVDTWVRSRDVAPTPGSDLEHLNTLIRLHGYTFPDAMMSVRLVHLLDPQKRKELMVIYSENLAPTGFAAADLLPGGKAFAQWPAIENALIQRAERTVTFEPLPPARP
jgi:hypothetical protein